MADTVAGLLRRHAADPNRTFAVLDGGVTTTYAEQLARSRRVAAGLRRRGAQPGDRVHVQLANCREFFDVWFATALSGTVLVPTSPQFSADELAHVLDDAAPVVSIRGAAEVDALCAGTAPGDEDTDDQDQDPGPVAAILSPPAPQAAPRASWSPTRTTSRWVTPSLTT